MPSVMLDGSFMSWNNNKKKKSYIIQENEASRTFRRTCGQSKTSVCFNNFVKLVCRKEILFAKVFKPLIFEKERKK